MQPSALLPHAVIDQAPQMKEEGYYGPLSDMLKTLLTRINQLHLMESKNKREDLKSSPMYDLVILMAHERLRRDGRIKCSRHYPAKFGESVITQWITPDDRKLLLTMVTEAGTFTTPDFSPTPKP